MNKPLICDVCGRDIYDKTTGTNYVGIAIDIPFEAKSPHKEYLRLRSMFGKDEFMVCFPCLLKAFGIKPIGEDIREGTI